MCFYRVWRCICNDFELAWIPVEDRDSEAHSGTVTTYAGVTVGRICMEIARGPCQRAAVTPCSI